MGLRLSAIAILPISVVISGCVPQGDLGRPNSNIAFHNQNLTLKAIQVADRQPVAHIPLTDAERHMRDKGYVVLYAPDIGAPLQPRPRFIRYSSVQPPTVLSANQYYRRIIIGRYQSSKARYNRLIDDIEKDRNAIRGFAPAAVRVISADAVRVKLLQTPGSYTSNREPQAPKRIAENNAYIDRVLRTSKSRTSMYEGTLKRLSVEQPEPEIERAFASLERLIQAQESAGARINGARAKARQSAEQVFTRFQDIDTAEQVNSLANPR